MGLSKRIILLGAPGSGKGTMASELSRRLNISHIATGDLFRKHLSENTALGQKAKSYMASGQLVPDDVTIAMVKERLKEDDVREGFIFDGFPRSLPQAVALDKMLEQLKLKIDLVLNLEVSEEEIIRRITTRRVCISCGQPYNIVTMPSKVEGVCDRCNGDVIQRQDDNEETLKSRLKTYWDLTAPLITYYRNKGLLEDIDNSSQTNEDNVDILVRRFKGNN